MSDLNPKTKGNESNLKTHEYGSEVVAGISCLDGSQISDSPNVASRPAKAVEKLNNFDGIDLDTGINNQQPTILHEYRQTKAFKTLLRRQAVAVRKI